jgi:hypothetical protein
MKKVFAFIMVFILIFSIDSYSADILQKKSKNNDPEQINKKGARFAHKTAGKNSQKRMQKMRIKNHNQKKTNNMWKS